MGALNPLVALGVVLALVSGTFVALQPPTNALMGRAVNSPVNAAFVSFAVGTVALLTLALALGVRPSLPAVRALPVYAWFGGLYGAFFVFAGVFAAPRLGMALYIALLIAGQLGMSLLLDHVGALGLDRQPISVTRVLGVVVILGGVLLIRR
ncbi:DMT family transporter [Sphingosinicella sp. BN140058]|uniref:DMT family transporter n=1 Tax=Sphingosinicella sp. BN140058 TaxID=1892855 RepID=UPI0019806579|nr:DMT family transporter [Sphingosinicella sp. BN140058]